MITFFVSFSSLHYCCSFAPGLGEVSVCVCIEGMKELICCKPLRISSSLTVSSLWYFCIVKAILSIEIFLLLFFFSVIKFQRYLFSYFSFMTYYLFVCMSTREREKNIRFKVMGPKIEWYMNKIISNHVAIGESFGNFKRKSDKLVDKDNRWYLPCRNFLI